MKWHRVFGLMLSLTCLLAVPRVFGSDKSEDSKKKVVPAKQAAPPPKAQPAPNAAPARTSPQSSAQPTQAVPNATPARTGPQPGIQPTQATPSVPSAKTGSQSGAPAAKTGPHLGTLKPVAEQTGPAGSAGAPKRVVGTSAKKQPRERSEYVPSDAQDTSSPEDIGTDTAVPESPTQDQDVALSPEVIKALTAVPESPTQDQDVALSPEVIRALTAVPESPTQDQDVALSPEAIKALTAVPAPTKFIEPVPPIRNRDVAPLPRVTEVVTQNEKTTGRSQVVEPAVKPPIAQRVPQKKVGPSQLSVGEPSMVRKVDGQYAVWNHGSAQGVQVGDEVKLVRGAEQIGRGQVIAVRANDCDLEIAETYAVASVSVGDRVKPLGRAVMP